MDGSPHDPFKALDTAFVPTKAVQRTIKAIERLHRRGTRADSANCLVLVGPSRVGKTAILRHYAKRHPPRRDGRQVIRPVVLVRLRTSTKQGAVLTAILAALGDANPESGSNPERELRILNHLRRQRVELLMFDEVNHLIDSESEHVGYNAANFIKALLNENICPILLCGVTHARRVTDTNDQLMGRGRGIIEIEPFDWRVHLQRIEWMVTLDRIEKEMRLPGASGLGDPGRAHRIHHVALGRLGCAVDLLFFALEIWEDASPQPPCLTDEILAEATDQLLTRERTRRLNAFRVAPPEKYEPAPMYDLLKDPKRRRRGKNSASAEDDLLA